MREQDYLEMDRYRRRITELQRQVAQVTQERDVWRLKCDHIRTSYDRELEQRLAALTPRWTTQPPQTPGFYFMYSAIDAPEVVEIYRDSEQMLSLDGCSLEEYCLELAEADLHWAGPLPQPEEAQG